MSTEEIAPTQGSELVPLSVASVESIVDAEVLSPQEQQAVEALSTELQSKFQDEDYTSNFGESAQAEVAKFAERAMGDTRLYELGPKVQKLLRDLEKRAEAYREIEAPKGFLGFRRLYYWIVGEVEWLLTKYNEVNEYIGEAERQFKKQINELSVGQKVNDEALEVNLRSRRALIVHIKAAKQVLAWARTEELPELQAKASATGSHSDAEVANDFAKICDIFELKIGALDKSLAITFIRKPEIELLRDGMRLALSTFRNLVNHAIPMWRQDMLLALGVQQFEMANENAERGRRIGEAMFDSNLERIGEAAKHAVKNAESGFISTEKIIEGTDKLLTSLAEVSAAFEQTMANARQAEKDRAVNNQRIKDFDAAQALPAT